MEKEKTVKRPSLLYALIVMVAIILTLMTGLLKFHGDMHMLLFICVIIASLAALKIGYSWDDLERGAMQAIHRALQAMLFFIMIGMIIGAWVQSGTVPALIYYGLDLLSPRFFLPAGLLISSIASLATGSSWSTAGTIGVALMGVGMGMGIPAPLVAGMVVSGAYFGDKMSPLSDTTNLAPAIAGTTLYEHIKAMMYTAVPAYIVTLLLYTVVGFKYAGATLDVENIRLIQSTLAQNFDLNVITLLPIVVVLGLSFAKFPALPGLAVGVAISIPLAMGFQHMSFVDALAGLNYGFSTSTGVEAIDTLLNRGGVQSMMWTFSLAFIALSLGGILTEGKILDVIIEAILKKVKSLRYYPTLTILTATAVNASMGEQYMGIVVTGELYRDAYPRVGLQARMLSRCLEEGGTLTSSLFPWTTCGAFMFGALGVSGFQYAPYAFFNLLNPLFGIVFTLLGFTLLTTDREKGKITIDAEVTENIAK